MSPGLMGEVKQRARPLDQVRRTGGRKSIKKGCWGAGGGGGGVCFSPAESNRQSGVRGENGGSSSDFGECESVLSEQEGREYRRSFTNRVKKTQESSP